MAASISNIKEAFRAATNDTVEPYRTDDTRILAWVKEACRTAVGMAPNASMASTYPTEASGVSEALEGAIIQYCLFCWAQSTSKHQEAQTYLSSFLAMVKAFATL